jgi:hypothetical protein
MNIEIEKINFIDQSKTKDELNNRNVPIKLFGLLLT